MTVADQPSVLAALPFMAMLQGIWTMLGTVALVLAGAVFVVVFCAALPLIVLVALVVGPVDTDRQGWRAVPA